MQFTTKAAFLIAGRWVWIKWTHSDGNKHAAMDAKGADLGAAAWDYGQADHYAADRFPVTR